MMKKISLVVLALLLCLSVTACAKKDPNAPDNMFSATVAGEPFRLYVPEGWSDNTTSGISSAYYSPAEKSIVSARYITPADPEMTLDAYMDFCAERYAEALVGFEITARDAAVLGGENAVKLSYKMKEGDKVIVCFQITAKFGADMISLNGYCAEVLYETLSPEYDKIVKAFVLCEKTDPNGEELIDKHTPEGMEIASADHLEYRLYVPKTWVCDAESGKSEAYYPESGKSNVTVSFITPDQSLSVKDYFLKLEGDYKTTIPSYERTEEPTERTVSGRTAYSYTYRATVDGVEFTVMQTLFTRDGKIYFFTYTALSENFALHLDDVNTMLDAFTFR